MDPYRRQSERWKSCATVEDNCFSSPDVNVSSWSVSGPENRGTWEPSSTNWVYKQVQTGHILQK